MQLKYGSVIKRNKYTKGEGRDGSV